MIELCSKKRMVLSCGMLVVVSVIILIIENNFSFLHGGLKEGTGAPVSNNETKQCWENDNSEILEECQKCTTFEIKVQDYCQKTGYREKVKCVFEKIAPKELYHSCPKVTWLEERNFWTFQSLSMFFGGASYLVVIWRQKRLDKLLIDKVHKQIAAGV